MATAHQQFSLKWNNYSQHIVSALEELRVDDELTDVTLSCDGKRIKAHKVLLSACSVFFKDTFKENPCKHPVVILKGVSFQDLQSVVQFMYNGQVNVTQERLPSFLQTAETLQIKGLTDSNNDNDGSTPAPIKKRPQTFPSQTSTVADSVRQDAEARPPTPKRKRVIGATSGTFPTSAQNSELPGTASVISSASGAAVAGAGGNSSSHHTNNNPPPPLLSRNNSDNSVDGLPMVKYEEEHDIDDEYERADDNDNSYQDNNGKEAVGGESNSLGSNINTSIRTCTLSTSGTAGERRPRYTMQQTSCTSANDLVAAAGVVDATNVNGRQQHNGHTSRADLIYSSSSSSSYAHTNGTLVTMNGSNSMTGNVSKLRHRLSSRSLSAGCGTSSGSQQQQDNQDRVIKYAPMQSVHHTNSSHDSRSNSSHEDVTDRHYLDEGSESLQGTDEDEELLHQLQQKRPSNGLASILVHHQPQKGRMPSLVKGSNSFSTQQSQPLNYRNVGVLNGSNSSRNGITKGLVAGIPAAEDLSASSPSAASASANEISTPSFSLTQQLLQQNVLSLISSNGGTEAMKTEGGGFATTVNRVTAITVQSSPVSSSKSSASITVKGEQPAALAAPYVCSICGKRYVHHRSLNDHKKSHTGATRCPVCDKSFSKVANMRAHYQAQHGLLSENNVTGGGSEASNSSSNNDNHPQQNTRVPVKQMA